MEALAEEWKYTSIELDTAKRIKNMSESKEKEAAIRGFVQVTGKSFPFEKV